MLTFAAIVAFVLGVVAQATAADSKLVRNWGLPFLALGLYVLSALMLLVALGVLL